MIWRFWEPEHVKLLRRAKARIRNPEQWCKSSYMYDTVTHQSATPDPDRLQDPTVKFCAVGSLMANAGARDYEVGDLPEYVKAISALRKGAMSVYSPDARRTERGVTYINDYMGHDSVMRMYDQAIKIAQKT